MAMTLATIPRSHHYPPAVFAVAASGAARAAVGDRRFLTTLQPIADVGQKT